MYIRDDLLNKIKEIFEIKEVKNIYLVVIILFYYVLQTKI